MIKVKPIGVIRVDVFCLPASMTIAATCFINVSGQHIIASTGQGLHNVKEGRKITSSLAASKADWMEWRLFVISMTLNQDTQ